LANDSAFVSIANILTKCVKLTRLIKAKSFAKHFVCYYFYINLSHIIYKEILFYKNPCRYLYQLFTLRFKRFYSELSETYIINIFIFFEKFLKLTSMGYPGQDSKFINDISTCKFSSYSVSH
jgi:hypothetical protein